MILLLREIKVAKSTQYADAKNLIGGIRNNKGY